jgi:hypothetical protein
MRVILVPTRLRLAAALLFLCVPIAALETVLVTRAPWWRLPYHSIGVWSASVALICVPLAAWIMRGRKWAYWLLQLFFSTWILLNSWVALRMRFPALAFFTLFLGALFGALLAWLSHELRRSFFDPRMRWYEGSPQPLPGLSCRVAWGDRELDCRVSRLDREGAFVFREGAEKAPLAALRPDVRSELTFRFRGRAVRCTGLPMRVLDGDRGAGFQFDGLGPDLRKQLGDFIESLKGEGYAL